ncbi:hypothetical protein D9M72_655620 [compost metagenome]
MRESSPLRISSAISVFCNCERRSRFMEPTTSSRPSITSTLECSIARDSPLTPLPPEEPNTLPKLVCSLRNSYSSTPAASSALRWRA